MSNPLAGLPPTVTNMIAVGDGGASRFLRARKWGGFVFGAAAISFFKRFNQASDTPPLDTPTAERSARPLRLLVVQDEPATLALTLQVLERLGHWSAGVSSAEAAIDRFLEGAFDVLLLDLNLPGLSGLDVAEKLRSRERIPVILAGCGTDRTQGFAGSVWLPKPYTAEQLELAVAQCLCDS